MSAENGSNGGRAIGYAHVSTSEQHLRLKPDTLKKHGVPKELLFTDMVATNGTDECDLDASDETDNRFEVRRTLNPGWNRALTTADVDC